MSKYSGVSFPLMFKGGSSSIVEDIEKIRGDILLLLSLQVRSLLMRPEVGIDTESILFADDVLITRDFVYTFVTSSILRDLPEVELINVFVNTDEDKIKIHLDFIYKIGSVEFSVDYLTGGLEQ